MADKSLSSYAHNVKVVSTGGAVVLKGPVHSQEEKVAVMAKAAEVAGSAQVLSQLSVVSSKNKSKKKLPSKT